MTTWLKKKSFLYGQMDAMFQFLCPPRRGHIESSRVPQNTQDRPGSPEQEDRNLENRLFSRSSKEKTLKANFIIMANLPLLHAALLNRTQEISVHATWQKWGVEILGKKSHFSQETREGSVPRNSPKRLCDPAG